MPAFMVYIIFILLLFGVELVYFRIADYYNIIDHPNERSSHSVVTILGGGIVFPLAILAYSLQFEFSYIYFTVGLFMISAISFWDDLYTLSPRIRIFVHLAAVSLMFLQLGINQYPLIVILVLYVIIIGIINAYNFMDGINGITGIYSLVTIMTLFFLNTKIKFIDPAFLIITSLSLVVFLFFNLRTRAKCFAGDVGSVSIAFIVVFCLLSFFLVTKLFIAILLLAVYGVDSVLTIIIRLSKGENIFTPHRSHVYQILSNERGFSHISVTIIYGLIQLVINTLVIYIIFNNVKPTYTLIIGISILSILSILYLSLKRGFRTSL